MKKRKEKREKRKEIWREFFQMNLPSYSRVINFLQVEYIYIYMYVDIDSFALIYMYMHTAGTVCIDYAYVCHVCTTTTLVFFKKIPPAPGAG